MEPRLARRPEEFPVLFSMRYGIEEADDASWFDATLTKDSPVFIDPFLLQFTEEPELSESFQDVLAHFQYLFERLASDRQAAITQYLYFPEVPEIGLGFTAKGRRGSGSGPRFARAIRGAMAHAIGKGVESPRHFEEIGLLRPGLGRDRISDITARLILPRLCAFTKRVCDDLGVRTTRQTTWTYARNATGRIIRRPLSIRVPKNDFDGLPIVLVPKAILRSLPTIGPDGFEDYLWDFHANELRADFNVSVKADIQDKVLSIANANLDWVRAYVEYEDGRGSRPYDFEADPAALVKHTRVGYRWGRSLPAPPQPSTEAEVLSFVAFLVRHFKDHIEHQRGYELLWLPGFHRHRTEKAAQRLFQAMARGLCDAYNVEISKETDAGTGPVDFKFSTGYRTTVLLELKHIASSKFWQGVVLQLPDYLKAQDARTAMFVAIAYRDQQVRSVRYRELPNRVKAASRTTGLNLRSERIDARPRAASASRL